MGDEDDPGRPEYWRGLAEGSTPFEPERAPSLQTLQLLALNVLQAYDFTCALTSQRFRATQSALHPDLELTAIVPLAEGGALHVTNYLCLSHAASKAFGHGHIAVGRGHRLLVDVSRIDPELLHRLNPSGRLGLPARTTAGPDLAALRRHLERSFLRDGDTG